MVVALHLTAGMVGMCLCSFAWRCETRRLYIRSWLPIEHMLIPFLPRQSPSYWSLSSPTLLLTRNRTMYSVPNLHLIHIILLISPLSLVAYAQVCDASDALYSCNATNIDSIQAECDTILNCPGGFTASNCSVQDWCNSKCADPDNCCSSEDSSSCFQSSFNDSTFQKCAYVADQINSCISATTGFATLSITDQASCFCTDGYGTDEGSSWNDAATTCYAAMVTQTALPTSQLDDYLTYYVDACPTYVEISTISSTGSTTVTKTVSIPSGVTSGTVFPTTTGPTSGVTSGTVPPTTTGPTAAAGNPSPTTTTSSTSTSSTNTGAKNGSEGSGMILGAFLIICCLIASLGQ